LNACEDREFRLLSALYLATNQRDFFITPLRLIAKQTHLVVTTRGFAPL
jgi:hypothetical protein